mmetsp:Transcript_57731/g.119318  ORF Transcript_57731/g.119318 Transcript_57731/m.119318 type:complete len:123 (-) Transcript_57731:320-688(-)
MPCLLHRWRCKFLALQQTTGMGHIFGRCTPRALPGCPHSARRKLTLGCTNAMMEDGMWGRKNTRTNVVPGEGSEVQSVMSVSCRFWPRGMSIDGVTPCPCSSPRSLSNSSWKTDLYLAEQAK